MNKIWHKVACNSIDKQFRRIAAKDFSQLENMYGFNTNTVHFYKDHNKMIAIYCLSVRQQAHYGMILQYRALKSPLKFNRLFIIRYFIDNKCTCQKSTCE